MSNQTITPNAGALSMLSVIAAPLVVAAGALSLVGNAPTLLLGLPVITPFTGALNMVSQASPVLGANTGVLSLVGQLATAIRTGQGPSLTPLTGQLFITNVNRPALTPLAGSLSFNGAAPTTALPLSIQPGAGALAFASDSIIQLLTLPPLPTGALSLVGQQPVVSQSKNPGAAALALVGQQPALIFQTTIAIPAGAISVLGGAPKVLVASGLAPGVGAVSLQGNQVSVVATLSAAPPTGTLSLAGMQPVINGQQQRTPNTGALAANGNAPTVVATINVLATPLTGGALFVGASPVLSAPATIITGTGALAMVGLAAVTAANQAIPSGAISLLGNAPLVSSGYAIPSGAASLIGNAPVIAQTFAVNSVPGSGSLGFASDPQQVTQGLRSGLFVGINLVSTFPNVWPYNVRPEPYGEFYLAVGDIEPFGIDFSGMLANRWSFGSGVGKGAVVRPTVPNGFQYRCTQGGASAATEPFWPPYIGGKVLDGSVVWQAEAQDEASLQGILQTASWSAPPPLTLSGSVLLAGSATSDQTAIIFVDTTNAVAGQDYLVLCTALIAGTVEKIVGTIKVKVR